VVGDTYFFLESMDILHVVGYTSFWLVGVADLNAPCGVN
jgi:hypothetical protein